MKGLVMKKLAKVEIARFTGTAEGRQIVAIVYKIDSKRRLNKTGDHVLCEFCRRALSEKHTEYRIRDEGMAESDYLNAFAACPKHVEDLEETVTQVIEELQESMDEEWTGDPGIVVYEKLFQAFNARV